MIGEWVLKYARDKSGRERGQLALAWIGLVLRWGKARKVSSHFIVAKVAGITLGCTARLGSYDSRASATAGAKQKRT